MAVRRIKDKSRICKMLIRARPAPLTAERSEDGRFSEYSAVKRC